MPFLILNYVVNEKFLSLQLMHLPGFGPVLYKTGQDGIPDIEPAALCADFKRQFSARCSRVLPAIIDKLKATQKSNKELHSSLESPGASQRVIHYSPSTVLGMDGSECPTSYVYILE